MMRGLLVWPLMVVASLAMAEIAGRAISWQAPPETDTGTPRQGLTANAPGDWTPNQRGVWIDVLPFPYYTVTNDAGFRNVEALDPEAVRILALGDSYTFGLTVSNHDTWTDLAEKLLRKRTQARLQILNNGIPGSTITDHIAYLREKGAAARPDYVLLVVHSNDVTDLRKESTSLGFNRAFEITAHNSVFLGGLRWWLRQHSGLYALARKAKEWLLIERFAEERVTAAIPANMPSPTAPDGGATARESARYAELLTEAVGLCRDIGARPVIVHLPSPVIPDDGLDDLLGKVAGATGADFLELRSAYEGTPKELLMWARDPALDPEYAWNSHLTRLGNALVGAAFATAFEPVFDPTIRSRR